MSRIAVIGAGQAGLVFSHKLLAAGFDVTLYSERTPEQWLRCCAPTGTAFLYEDVIQIERDLALDYWSEKMHAGHGVLMDYCQAPGRQPLQIRGHFSGTGGAVDQRLKIHRWLHDFIDRGGSLMTENVTPERLDEISQSAELTVLATGKAQLSRIIPRDNERSVYHEPQRNLAMAIVDGVKGWGERVDFTPVKFTFLHAMGEYFAVPFTHKTAGNTWSILIEARPGSALDRFMHCSSGPQVVEEMRAFIQEYAPWDYAAVKHMRYVENDDFAWLKGRFPPTIRCPFGKLESGRPIMPIGDSAMLFDPIGGQGGNNATRNALYMAEAVIARGADFDEDWMTAVNQNYWDRTGEVAYRFNNMLLEPMTEAGELLLQQAAADSGFASRYFTGNFPSPGRFFPWVEDVSAVKNLAACQV
ncbi:MAG: styrene monooxygenase/indole monooxygenase family protein [Pseudomonadales bacterium]